MTRRYWTGFTGSRVNGIRRVSAPSAAVYFGLRERRFFLSIALTVSNSCLICSRASSDMPWKRRNRTAILRVRRLEVSPRSRFHATEEVVGTHAQGVREPAQRLRVREPVAGLEMTHAHGGHAGLPRKPFLREAPLETPLAKALAEPLSALLGVKDQVSPGMDSARLITLLPTCWCLLSSRRYIFYVRKVLFSKSELGVARVPPEIIKSVRRLCRAGFLRLVATHSASSCADTFPRSRTVAWKRPSGFHRKSAANLPSSRGDPLHRRRDNAPMLSRNPCCTHSQGHLAAPHQLPPKGRKPTGKIVPFRW